MPAVPIVFFQSMGCVLFMMQPAENRHSCSAEPLLLSTNRNKAVRPERRSTGHVCAPQSFLVTGSGYLISIRKEMLLIQSAAVSSLDQAAAGLLQFLSAFWNITVLPLLTDLRVRLQVFCSGLPQDTRVLLDLALDALKTEGIKKVALLVFNRNEAGNAFWERQGFTARDDVRYRNRALAEMIRIDT